MTREEEKLKTIDNTQLALEFTKEFNECIKKQVPKESAALAVLHDLADWKDEHPRKGLWDAEKVIEWLKDNSKKYVVCYEDGYSHYAYNSMIDDFKNYMQNESEK